MCGEKYQCMQTKLPGKWIDFLHDPINKRELFSFLLTKVSEFTFPPNKAVYVTFGESVVSVGHNIPVMTMKKLTQGWLYTYCMHLSEV